jgi:hypothetical protein
VAVALVEVFVVETEVDDVLDVDEMVVEDVLEVDETVVEVEETVEDVAVGEGDVPLASP